MESAGGVKPAAKTDAAALPLPERKSTLRDWFCGRPAAADWAKIYRPCGTGLLV